MMEGWAQEGEGRGDLSNSHLYWHIGPSSQPLSTLGATPSIVHQPPRTFPMYIPEKLYDPDEVLGPDEHRAMSLRLLDKAEREIEERREWEERHYSRDKLKRIRHMLLRDHARREYRHLRDDGSLEEHLGLYADMCRRYAESLAHSGAFYR